MLNTMVDEDKVSRDLKPSQELLEKIALVKDSLNTAGKLVKEAYDLAIRDGFNPQQARQFLTAQLPFLAERTIRLALPAEAKDQSKVRTNFAARMPQKEPNVVNITTEHKVINVEPEQSYNPEEEIKKIGEIRRAEQKREAEEPIIPDDEDPKDLEIQFLKEQNEELKDALHKTEQFRQASQLQQPPPIANPDEHYFKWLADRDNGVTCYYYDGYGVELFKSRVLTQLKSKGVTTFKRLYFEV